MISIDEALAACLDTARPLPAETVAVTAAAGRVLAAAVNAAIYLPRFDQSALDGYAFRAADTATASADAPVRLVIAQRIAAGPHGPLPLLLPGTCARIFTGAAVPPGADAVVAQERAVVDDGAIRLDACWPPFRNLRRRGEEQRAGDAVADAGQRIGTGLLAALINAGAETLPVTRRPRVAVLTTGDEVRPAGSALAAGELPDSNGPLIAAYLAARGAELAMKRHLRDDADAVREAMAAALDAADLVITAGGASVGEHDFIVSTAQDLGLRRVFWKIAQKPGKPLLLAVRDGPQPALLLGLPGNPGAVLACLSVYAQRLLDRLEGCAEPGPRWAPGVLETAVPRDRQRARLLRMRLSHNAAATARLQPLSMQDSHMLSNLREADVLVRIDAGEEPAAAGSLQRWMPLPR